MKYVAVDMHIVTKCPVCGVEVPTFKAKDGRRIATHTISGKRSQCRGSRLPAGKTRTGI